MKMSDVDMGSNEVFEISGYYAGEDPDEGAFSGYLVCAWHCCPEKWPNGYEGSGDEDIFFYGLDEEGIKHAIETGDPVNNDFHITSYEKLDYTWEGDECPT
jgi:hypothetical protein